MAKRRPSGDGMVRKREDGRWEGRIVVGHKSNGDSIFRYLSAGSQKELLAKAPSKHRGVPGCGSAGGEQNAPWRVARSLAGGVRCPLGAALHSGRIPGICRAEYQAPPGNKPVGKITVEDIRQLYWELQEHGRQEEHPQYGYKLAGSTVSRIHGVLHEALTRRCRKT